MSFFKIIGQNILEILEEKKLTQSELANKIGVSKQVMTKIVKEKKAINALEIRNIAKVLDTSVDRLIAEPAEKHDMEPVFMFMGKVNEKNVEKFTF